MTARYVVMPVAEARASGRRAAGFLSRARAESCAALLNSRPPGRYASQAPRWWMVGESDTHAVVDTAADRLPASGWAVRPIGSGWSGNSATLEVPGYRVSVFDDDTRAHWNIFHATSDYPSAAVASGEEPTLAAAMLAAESAAAALLVDALLALGETGREAMRKAGEGRK